MMPPDSVHVGEIIREAAAVEIMPRFRSLKAHQVREKKPGDLVTEADVEAEHFLTRRLRQLLPEAAVVGEEAAARDPELVGALERPGPVWIVDPVDGTRNFAHERPVFGVIVALVVDGRTERGWIYDPIGDVMMTAGAGQGAWIGERRLRAAAAVSISQLVGSLGYRRNKRVQASVARLTRHGSVAHDYMHLARGDLHFAYYKKLMPWDHAAGVLAFTEAGGHAALLDGTPYHPLPSPVGGLLLAPDRKSWETLRPLVAE